MNIGNRGKLKRYSLYKGLNLNYMVYLNIPSYSHSNSMYALKSANC